MKHAWILALVACSHASAPRAPAKVTVEQAAALFDAHAAIAVDANVDEVRARQGVVPGAILLADYEDLSPLPPDHATELVFYCANEQCSASDEAAKRAIAAGYAKVDVMADGITGWHRAGRATRSIE